MSKRAFTLIELLVVIGIIGVLIAILIPALSRSRAQARSIACQSNLRQWAVAVIAYATESNGALPRRGQGVQKLTNIDRPADWFNALPPMLKQERYVDRFNAGRAPTGRDGSLWSCPEFEVTDAHPHQLAYAMNIKLSPQNGIFPDKINRIGPTSTMVFMADAPGPYSSIVPGAAPAANNPVARHRGRVNIAFLDGHVASFLGSEVGINVGEIQRTDMNWTPKNSTWSGPNSQ